MSATLTHLTLNTGHTRESPRAEVGADILALLAPLVAEGGGPLPPPFTGYRLTIVRGEDEAAGSAIFTFSGAGDLPLATGLVCWREAASSDAWGKMADLLAGAGALAGATIPATPRRPSSVPWLAVMLWPAFMAAPDAATWSAVSWLGDAERCVAWALIEEGRP